VSVIIDAGFRCTWLTVKECVDFIGDMLSHTVEENEESDDGSQLSKEVEERIHPLKVFLTHSHEDHTNLVMHLIDDGIIEKTGTTLKARNVFFGGSKEKYAGEITALTGNSISEGRHGFTDYSVDCYRIDGRPGCNEINGHGAVISLNFAGRIFAFLGDINGHTITALTAANNDTRKCLKNFSQAPERVLPILKQADIVTTSHHGSLANGEDAIYNWMALQANKKERIFIASAAPCSTGSATYPRIKSEILPFVQLASATTNANKTVFYHYITFDIIPHDHEIRQETAIPLFSTYDAPYGFVWTCIEPNGRISIHNGVDFIEVLSALTK
jgi:hypothetical protein